MTFEQFARLRNGTNPFGRNAVEPERCSKIGYISKIAQEWLEQETKTETKSFTVC